jgi:hypothetical protein
MYNPHTSLKMGELEHVLSLARLHIMGMYTMGMDVGLIVVSLIYG